jgi:hypothetical protein
MGVTDRYRYVADITNLDGELIDQLALADQPRGASLDLGPQIGSRDGGGERFIIRV